MAALRTFFKISARTLLALGALAAVLLGVAYFKGEEALRSTLEKRARDFFGRAVSIGSLNIDLPGRSVELKDILIPGLSQSKRPSARIPALRIALSLRSFLARDPLFRAIVMERPEFSVEVFKDGSNDLPRLADAAAKTDGPQQRVRIERLAIAKGELFLNEGVLPLQLDFPNVNASLTSPSGWVQNGELEGRVSAGPGPIKFGANEARDARLELTAKLVGTKLTLSSGRFDSSVTQASLTGAFDLSAPAPRERAAKEPRGTLQLVGKVDLEEFEKVLMGTSLGLKGSADARIDFALAATGLQATGSLRGEKGGFDGLEFDTYSGALNWKKDALHLSDFAIQAYGGAAKLDIAIKDKGETALDVELDSVKAEPVLRWLFDWGPLDINSKATGRVKASWASTPKLWNGDGLLTFASDPSSADDPVAGRIQFGANDGVFRVSQSRFEAPKTLVTWQGTIDPQRRVASNVSLESSDIARTDAFGLKLRQAVGGKAGKPLGATGRGQFDGEWRGTLDEPVFAGRFVGDDIHFLQNKWGRIDWVGEATPLLLRSERLVAQRGNSKLELSGDQRLGEGGIDDQEDLRIDIASWPAQELLRVANTDFDIDANVSGRVELKGSAARPSGKLALKSETGTAMGIAYLGGTLDADLDGPGQAIRVNKSSAFMAGGTFLVSGSFPSARDAPWKGQGSFSNLELEELARAQGVTTSDTAAPVDATESPSLGGRVSGQFTFGGTPDRPTLDARAESRRIFYGDEGIGALTIDAKGEGTGQLRVEAALESRRFHATATGSVGAQKPFPTRLSFALRDARLDPVLRAGTGAQRIETTLGIIASAQGEIEGSLEDPRSMTARVRGGKLRVALPDYTIDAAPDFAIDVLDGRARISQLSLSGDGTALSLGGDIALDDRSTHDLSIQGRADLRILQGFKTWREWRTRGAAIWRAQLRGPRASPRLVGGLDLEDAAVRLRTFPQGIDKLRGRVNFSETSAQLVNLDGEFGGGRVTVSGQALYGSSTKNASFDLSLTGRSLGVRYPEGLRATIDANLRLFGNAQAQWITGNVNVAQALWSRRYDITDEFLPSSSRAIATTLSADTEATTRLDIQIRAPGTLRVDNNLANVVARGDLSLTGTPAEPVLLGRAEIERGRVVFRGDSYELRKGVLDFSNPRAIDPVFDVEAETRIRTYRLTLQAHGTFERVTSQVTSDPPRTTMQIASLLSGGSEDDLSRAASGDFRQAAGAAVAAVISEGISNQVAQTVGLSRLSIAPTKLIEGGKLGAARLVVGKRLTPDLELLYSSDVGAQRSQNAASIEYSLRNRFSIVLTREEPRGWGADVRTRITLDK